MTSKEVKDLMVGRLGFYAGYMGCVTEVVNHNSADVIGVRWHGRTVVEFEIKVSRNDLVSELKAIRAAWGIDEFDAFNFKLSHTKFNKHREYARQDNRHFKPHLFNFCLPEKLCEVACENLKGLPYGVYCYETDTYIKKPRRLHSNPIDAEKALALFSRACTQWADSRHDLQQTLQSIEEQPSIKLPIQKGLDI